MKSDIYALFDAALKGEPFETEWYPEAVLGVVMASKGYPGSYEKGAEIKGLDNVEGLVFHMGTSEKDGKIFTSGGRVLMVTGRGADLTEANANALADVERIDCDAMFHRHDIGKAAL